MCNLSVNWDLNIKGSFKKLLCALSEHPGLCSYNYDCTEQLYHPNRCPSSPPPRSQMFYCISQILTFAMPVQLRMAITTVNIAHFISGQSPTFTDNIEVLKTWPIPSHNLLNNIQEKALEMHSMSICYPHVPTSHPARQLHFPLWVFTYWMETSLLCMYMTGPWSSAELWLTKERTATASYHSPDRQCLCEEAQAMFLAIPWAGDVHRFTKAEPVIKLASYLS